MRIETGVTRIVFITKHRAYKIPYLFSWRFLLMGLLANMQEVEWAAYNNPVLCPVNFWLPGGWLVVMPTCEPADFHKVDFDDFQYVPLDPSPSNFGKYRGRIVLFDYGGTI